MNVPGGFIDIGGAIVRRIDIMAVRARLSGARCEVVVAHNVLTGTRDYADVVADLCVANPPFTPPDTFKNAAKE